MTPASIDDMDVREWDEYRSLADVWLKTMGVDRGP